MSAPAYPTLSTRTVLSRPGGLSVEVDAHGVLRKLALGDVVVNLYVGHVLEAGPANLVLRRLDQETTSTPLLGPRSPTRWRVDAAAGTLDGEGTWNGLRYQVALRLAEEDPAWFWHVRVENTGSTPVRVDLTMLQDLALAPYGAIRLNEYYVAQYIDHAPLAHPTRGTVLAARQNQAVGGRYPWCVTGSLHRAVAHATDALQVHGLGARAAWPESVLGADLPATRLQHEHALAALQDAASDLAPGAAVELGFFGRVLPDHPAATGPEDLAQVDATLALAAARAPAWPTDLVTTPPAASLYSTAALLAVQDLDDSAADAVFGAARRHVERDAAGRLLGFFHGTDAAVALRAKELAVLRPHGQVLRTGHVNLPDESALTSTAWMGGVFHSMLTQGHVSINRCLSTARSYLGLFRAQGLRVFVEIDGAWTLLDQPSAFEMQPDACRWVYRHGSGRIDVTSRAHGDPHGFGLDLEVVDGVEARFLVCLHVALNGDDGSTPGRVDWDRDGAAIRLRPAAGTEQRQRFPEGHWRIEPSVGTSVASVGGDETLFLDGASRDLPCLTLTTTATRSARFMLLGRLVTDAHGVRPSGIAADDTGADPVTGGLMFARVATTADQSLLREAATPGQHTVSVSNLAAKPTMAAMSPMGAWSLTLIWLQEAPSGDSTTDVTVESSDTGAHNTSTPGGGTTTVIAAAAGPVVALYQTIWAADPWARKTLNIGGIAVSTSITGQHDGRVDGFDLVNPALPSGGLQGPITLVNVSGSTESEPPELFWAQPDGLWIGPTFVVRSVG